MPLYGSVVGATFSLFHFKKAYLLQELLSSSSASAQLLMFFLLYSSFK